MTTMHAEEIGQLADSQLEAFDREYIQAAWWPPLLAYLNAHFPDGDFSLLDVGCGAGSFLDRILSEYPHAEVSGLDNSALLLGRNKPDPRKTLIHESAENLPNVDGRYDVIAFNWVLHHMVTRHWQSTQRMQEKVLARAAGLLTDRGRVLVIENFYEGRLIASLAPWLIYQLTSSRLLAPITRRTGANTGGVGVAFHCEADWSMLYHFAGYAIDAVATYQDWTLSRQQKALGVGRVFCRATWLKAL